MVDMSTKTIRRLFQRQIEELTKRTIIPREELIDFQLSGGWLR